MDFGRNVWLYTLIALASAYDFANVFFHYSAYGLAIGIIIILLALAFFISNLNKESVFLRNAGIGIAFAVIIAITPDLSFQYVHSLALNDGIVALISALIIAGAMLAYAAKAAERRSNKRGEDKAETALLFTCLLLGFLGLFSLAFISKSSYLDMQAFDGAVLFIDEGILALFLLLAYETS